MAYTPNTWAAGDTITAQKLNNMEQGIANAGTIILETEYDAEYNLSDVDMTAAEIVEAVKAGKKVYLTLLLEEENTKNYMPFAGEYLVDGELAYALFGVSGYIYIDSSKHCYEELPNG